MTPAVRAQLAVIAAQAQVPTERLHEEWAERAAIREYLGELPRAKAEAAALKDVRSVFGRAEAP